MAEERREGQGPLAERTAPTPWNSYSGGLRAAKSPLQARYEQHLVCTVIGQTGGRGLVI
jgi:hypothetical protein